MNKLDALNELNSLVEKGIIKYSEFEQIRNIAKHENLLGIDGYVASDLLTKLVDDGSLSHDAYDALKAEVNAFNSMDSRNVVNTEPKKKEPIIKGFLLGFVLGIFVGIIGLVLGIVLGDEDSKKGSITGFCISAVIGIVFSILSFFFFKDFFYELLNIIKDTVPPSYSSSEVIASLRTLF